MTQPGVVCEIGSMGSEFWRFHVPPWAVPALAEKVDWNAFGRRVFIDPVTGLIAMMNPSPVHESYADGVGDLVKALGQASKTPVASLRETRWRGPGDPERSGSEADACFYFGEKALAWREAAIAGHAAMDAFADGTPPDLVVEVERSHGDDDKPGFYRAIGAPEMWRVDVVGEDLTVEFLDLQAENGVRPMEGSAQLPLCTRAFVLEGLALARASVDLDDLAALVRRAMEADKTTYEPP